MLNRYSLFPCFLLIILLSGCGGSSSSDTASIEPGTNTINGSINSAANMQFDSDLNDRNTPFIDNSEFTLAQKLQNFVTLQGFVTKVPTREFFIPGPNKIDERIGDRYYNTADAQDYFQVQLQAGQRIQLQVVNFEEIDGEAFLGDIDLSLYNQAFEVIDNSDSSNEFEYVQAPANGSYYIRAVAWSGASKYILQILPASPQANISNNPNASNSMNFEPNQLIVQYKNALSFQAANTNMKTLHTGVTRPTLAYINEADTFNISASSASNELAKLNPLSYQKLLTLNKLKVLKQQSNVLDASLNFIREKQRVPSDSFYEYQWHFESMNLPQAWDITTGTPSSGSIIVAVIDTGIYSSHPELTNQLVSGYDFIADNDNSGDSQPGIDSNPEDPGDGQGPGSSSWHGTHVAGTIAAQSNNNAGVAGVSWGAKIMPLRALGKAGGSTYDIMQAMLFAAGLENDSGTLPNQRADIINLSLGGTGSSSFEASLYKQIHDLGVIIVAAAGNENTSSPAYPASYPGVISVSATDFRKIKAPYSNFGNHIDIAAPGGNTAVNLNGDGQPDGVLSTLVDDTSGTKKASYSFYQGTSMAAPHVSGMFALMKAVYPSLNATSIDNLLANGALTNEAGDPGRDDIYGYGNANALKAVQAALEIENGGSLPTSPPILLASPSDLSFSNSAQASVVISNEGDGDPTVTSAYSNNFWLSISPSEVDSKGLGSYLASVDIENLSDGFYLGSLVFTFDNSPSLSVRVALNVGDLGTSGKLSTIYTLLYNLDTDNVVMSAQGINNNTENVEFKFDEVPQGRYEIISGTDVDNDGFICQLGEACAIYPPTSQIDPITLTSENTVNIEMTAIILNTLNSVSEQGKRAFHGVSIKKPINPAELTNIEKKVGNNL